MRLEVAASASHLFVIGIATQWKEETPGFPLYIQEGGWVMPTILQLAKITQNDHRSRELDMNPSELYRQIIRGLGVDG